jgi:hypothetical protein
MSEVIWQKNLCQIRLSRATYPWCWLNPHPLPNRVALDEVNPPPTSGEGAEQSEAGGGPEMAVRLVLPPKCIKLYRLPAINL